MLHEGTRLCIISYGRRKTTSIEQFNGELKTKVNIKEAWT